MPSNTIPCYAMSQLPTPVTAAASKSGIFYGWYMVAVVFLVLTICSGLTVYSLSVYLHAFVAEGLFSTGQVSFASGIFSAAAGLVGLGVGRLLDRHDVRHVITGGVLLMAAAMLALPLVRNLPALYGFYLVLGVGYGTAALIPCTTLVARWFTEKRSVALSIASTGNSFGAIVLTPPVALLIGELGIGRSGVWIALIMLLGILPMTWFVLRSWPRDRNLAAYGEAGGAAAPAAADSGDEEYRVSVRTRFYRMLNVSFMLGMAAHVGGQTHLFNLLMHRGADLQLAGLAIALMATSSVLARFLAVAALVRMSTRGFLALLLAVQGAALYGCGVATNTIVLMACIVVYGSTLGNLVTMQSLLLAETFGTAAYSRLYGLSRVWSVPGVLLGPGLMGLFYTWQQAYGAAYFMAATLSMAGVLALMLAGPSTNAAGGSRVVVAGR